MFCFCSKTKSKVKPTENTNISKQDSNVAASRNSKLNSRQDLERSLPDQRTSSQLIQQNYQKGRKRRGRKSTVMKVNYAIKPKDSLMESKLALLGKKKLKHKGKKTLILNLDETLTHSKFGRFDDCDKFLSFKGETNYYAMSVYKRPYLDQFLEFAFENFEVVFYTAATEQYANNLIDEIDPQNEAVARLFRDSCLDRDGMYFKTIDRLRRKLSTVIVLESNPITVCFNTNNVVPIKCWFGNKKDKELKDLIPILKSLSKVKDVRSVISKIFDQMGITHAEANELVNDLYQIPDNIDKNHRYAYQLVAGNYYEPLPEYDPEVLVDTYKQGQTIKIKDPKYRFPAEERNYVLFCHAMRDRPQDELKTEEALHDEENVNPGFQNKIHYNQITEEDEEESSFVKSYNKKKTMMKMHGVMKKTITESDPSFAQQMVKNLREPSSVSMTIGNSEIVVDPDANKEARMSDNLKQLFCFDQ